MKAMNRRFEHSFCEDLADLEEAAGLLGLKCWDLQYVAMGNSKDEHKKAQICMAA